MNHARSENFHPSCVLAARASSAVAELALDIHFSRWLGEWKEARTESCFCFSKETIREIHQRGFQVDEADSFVDGESFYLCEHRRVRCVEEIAAIRIARSEDSNRRLVRLQRADLNRRRMRSQKRRVTQVDRVVHIQRGVIRREIERSEVVPVAFSLRAERDSKAKLAEDVLDLFDHDGDGMSPAFPAAAGRHSEIDFRTFAL